MLRILCGPDHKVNTQTLVQRLLQSASSGADGLILLVPEQYSFETERMLCRLGGDTVCRYAEVLSFTRLADRVECACGGAAKRWLDHGGRLLAAAQAVDQVLSRIKLYAAVCKKPEFLEMFLLAVDEFGNYGVTPEALRLASQRAGGQFALKLEELALLLESYYAVCTQAKDPAMRLRSLADTLAREDFAAGREIFIDGFTDFTALEMEIVSQLLLAADVTIALPQEKTLGEAFPSAQQTIRALEKFCAAKNVPVETERLGFDETVPPDLLHVQKNVSSPVPSAFAGEMPNVLCAQAADRDAMCRDAVRRIRRLIAGGARCREIAIACQNSQTLPALESALRRAELPYFVTGREPVTGHSGVRAVLTALRCVTGGMERDDVIDYLKSGVTPLSEDACDRLENYAILWNIHGAQWEREWKNNPRELSETMREGDVQRLASLNAWRDTAIAPLAALREQLRGAKTVGEMAAAVTSFLREAGFFERMQSYADAFYAAGDFLPAQQYAQICELLLGALGQMDLILRECSRTPEEFYRLFEKLMGSYTVGAVPAAADQIAVGTAASLRGKSVKHLLILDADDAHFPAPSAPGGVFTEEERRALLSQGVPLAPDRADAMERELSGLYLTIRAATQSLALYCVNAPSFLTKRIAGGQIAKTDDLLIPLSAEEAASAALRSGAETAADPRIAACLPELEARRSYAFGQISPDAVRHLYGDVFRLSASQIDRFAGCRFSYFLCYGLRAKRREELKFNAAEFGTFVHKVLEDTAREVMQRGGFHTVSPEDVQQIASRSADRYAETHLAAMLEKDERFARTFARNREEAFAVVRDMAEELRVSDFEPAAFELHFDDPGDLPAVRAEGEKAACLVRGFVDRADIYRSGGRTYIRVVDYKTGRKDFDYADLTIGQGMQMLIYLFALKRGGAKLYGEAPEPAGVLYLPARQDVVSEKTRPTPEQAAKKQAELHRRKGLIRESDDLIAAMEHFDDMPRYLPIKKKREDSDLASGEQMQLLERFVFRQLGQIADGIASGDVQPNPVSRGAYGACTYCDYRDVCQKDFAKHNPRSLRAVKNSEFFEELERREENHG